MGNPRHDGQQIVFGGPAGPAVSLWLSTGFCFVFETPQKKKTDAANTWFSSKDGDPTGDATQAQINILAQAGPLLDTCTTLSLTTGSPWQRPEPNHLRHVARASVNPEPVLHPPPTPNPLVVFIFAVNQRQLFGPRWLSSEGHHPPHPALPYPTPTPPPLCL